MEISIRQGPPDWAGNPEKLTLTRGQGRRTARRNRLANNRIGRRLVSAAAAAEASMDKESRTALRSHLALRHHGLHRGQI
jgi:hypothetical protein